MDKMRKFISLAMFFVVAISVLCTSTGATEAVGISAEEYDQDTMISVLATGSFNMSVIPF